METHDRAGAIAYWTFVVFLTSLSSAHPIARTVCTNVLGINYSGGDGYQPSLLPGLIAGSIVAVLLADGVRRLARRIASRHVPAPPIPV